MRSGKPKVLFVAVGSLRQRRVGENRYFLVCTQKCLRLYWARLSSLVLQAHAILCRSVQPRIGERLNWQDGTVFPENSEGTGNLRLQLHTRNRYVVHTAY